MTSSSIVQKQGVVKVGNRRARFIFAALLCAVASMMACDAVNSIVSNPVFICPSPTPYFPYDFHVNQNTFYPTGSSFNIQYVAEGTGPIWLSYVEYGTGSVVLFSETNIEIADAPVGLPEISGTYPVFIVSGAQIISGSVIDSVQGISYTFTAIPNGQIGYPTIPPFPSITPRPTATPFSLTNNFYLGDTVYTYASTNRIGITLLSTDSVPINAGADEVAFIWTFQITNIGGIEYDFYPYFQSYLSGVSFGGDPVTNGIWVASLALGEQMGYPISVLPVPIQPGQSQTFTLFSDGFNGGDQIATIAFILDAVNHNALSPTVVPGSNIIQFVNQTDPYCHVQIQPPTLLPPVTVTS